MLGCWFYLVFFKVDGVRRNLNFVSCGDNLYCCVYWGQNCIGEWELVPSFGCGTVVHILVNPVKRLAERSDLESTFLCNRRFTMHYTMMYGTKKEVEKVVRPVNYFENCRHKSMMMWENKCLCCFVLSCK